MIHHILVPTDLSASAKEAFRYAMALAGHLGASIDLLYVDAVTAQAPSALSLAIQSGDLPGAQQQLAVQHEASAGVAVRTHIVSGSVGEQILAQQIALQADLIVMGYTGEQKSDRMGSVTQEIIAQAAVPVIAIPHACSYRPIQHMIYASNFEHLDPEDSEQLLEMAALMEARLSCLHVAAGEQPEIELEESLFEVVYEQAKGQQTVQFYYTQSQDIRKGIADFVQKHEGDLLIMMRHQHLVAGKSLTSQMIQISQVPLMALHEKRRGNSIPRPTDH